MEFQVVGSSVALALVALPLLAARWRIGMKLGVAGALVIGLATGLTVAWLNSRWLHLGLATLLPLQVMFILLLAGLFVLLRFYRDPERTPLEREGVVLSPADGEVLYVRKIQDDTHLVSVKGRERIRLDEIMKAPWPWEGGYLVGIGMNLLNVHVNRAPLGGRIVRQKRIKGKFLSLRRPEAEALNERVTTVIDSGVMQVAVVQIASRLVRGIVSYVKEGDVVEIGQRLGMIRFGSQVDLVIPPLVDCKIAVSPGDKVTAGVSVLARHTQPAISHWAGERTEREVLR